MDGKISITTRIENGFIFLRAPFSDLDLVRTIPGRHWDKITKLWNFPADANYARKILDVFGDKIADPKPLKDLAEIPLPPRVADNQIPVNDIPCSVIPPWDHQKRAYWFVRSIWDSKRSGALLAMDMGTGKSKVAIDLICSLQLTPALILCPKAVIPVWPKQFEIHASAPYTTFISNSTHSITRRAKCAKWFLDQEPKGIKVVVANYESIDNDSTAFKDFIDKTRWELVICDEVHRIKSHVGVRSKFLGRAAVNMPRRLGLTGTPLPHSPLDAFGQFRFLDRSIFGTSFVSFRSQYAVMGGFGGYQIFGFKQQTEMARLMSSIMYQVSADEVLDLPDAVHTIFPVELSKSTREIYDQMESDFVCWVKEGVAVSAANALVKLLHLSQITGGFISDEEKNIQKLWDTKNDTSPEKASALEEILEDLPINEPVVVFSRFKMDVEIIAHVAEKTKRTYSRLTGDVNELSDWQEGKKNILIANIQAGKEGIDLTRSHYSIYYSVGFSLGDYEQSLARVRRPGQKSETVFYYHIVATKTVDEKVYKALEQKKDVIDHVLSEAKHPS